MKATDTTQTPQLAPSERRKRALEIAAKRGPKVADIVERMDFREASAREKAIASTLKGKASAALKRHGGATA